MGDIISWSWNFGDGDTSSQQTPQPIHYPKTGQQNTYVVSLIVQNNAGCYDTTATTINVLKTCYIAVPSAFTPNGDGNNDYLYPLNAYKADNLEFKVYNRLGQLVFQTTDWTVRWDGKINGVSQATGTYVWTLSYTEREYRQESIPERDYDTRKISRKLQAPGKSVYPPRAWLERFGGAVYSLL